MVRLGNRTLHLRLVQKGVRAQPSGSPTTGASGEIASLPLRALVSGRVHAVLFRKGALVPAHQNWILVESLGLLVPHALPVDARVTSCPVESGAWVQAGQVLAEFLRESLG